MLLSPPSRRRGLKFSVGCFTTPFITSPPSRRRGLKFNKFYKLFRRNNVASFSEAWIEIFIKRAKQECSQVASFSEAWIEIQNSKKRRLLPKSPPSRRRGLKYDWDIATAAQPGRLLLGGVDWNTPEEKKCMEEQCRLLLGGVDWNHFFVSLDVESLSRLLLGGVDWNSIASLDFSCHLVASFLEAWIEIFCFFFLADGFLSPPSWRRGLKSCSADDKNSLGIVASFLEAWIEIRKEWLR